MSDSVESNELVFLTLGDGDFSFSLDLARYLAAHAASVAAAATGSKARRPTLRLIATGIDSLEELTQKYKDSPFLLRQLTSLNQSDDFSVCVQHGINAVLAPTNNKRHDDNKHSLRADHVIFNHPHLGTENAALHSRFLCHVFFAVTNVWLRDGDGGRFHLTLAAGQYERWKCPQAADRHGMVAMDRCSFQSPPVPNPHYQYRRHQTGKSFENRTGGDSETITFCRRIETQRRSKVSHHQPCRLFWYRSTDDDSSIATKHDIVFKCPHCDRTFREERSVKNHVQSKHTDPKKRKRDADALLTCPHCPTDRVFESSQALQDHLRAKHSSSDMYNEIRPDWCLDAEMTETNPSAHGSCGICDQVFRTELEAADHSTAFIPVATGAESDAGSTSFKCVACSKGFREKRAQLQHENVCPARTTE
jgi:uncharacterized C2H2 Zn-finger protein